MQYTQQQQRYNSAACAAASDDTWRIEMKCDARSGPDSYALLFFLNFTFSSIKWINRCKKFDGGILIGFT